MREISAMKNGIYSTVNVKTGSKLIPKLMKPGNVKFFAHFESQTRPDGEEGITHTVGTP